MCASGGNRDTDPAEQPRDVLPVKLEEHLVRQSQAAQHGRAVCDIGILDRALADVRGLPELAVRPPAACEEVEAAAVVADLVAPPHQPILVLDDELSRR